MQASCPRKASCVRASTLQATHHLRNSESRRCSAQAKVEGATSYGAKTERGGNHQVGLGACCGQNREECANKPEAKAALPLQEVPKEPPNQICEASATNVSCSDAIKDAKRYLVDDRGGTISEVAETWCSSTPLRDPPRPRYFCMAAAAGCAGWGRLAWPKFRDEFLSCGAHSLFVWELLIISIAA